MGGCLVLVALPPLLRPRPIGNATVLPLDYGRNLALALAAVAVLTAALIAVPIASRARRRRPRP